MLLLQALAHVLLAEPIKLCDKVPGTDVLWSDLLQEGLIHAVYAVRMLTLKRAVNSSSRSTDRLHKDRLLHRNMTCFNDSAGLAS